MQTKEHKINSKKGEKNVYLFDETKYYNPMKSCSGTPYVADKYDTVVP